MDKYSFLFCGLSFYLSHHMLRFNNSLVLYSCICLFLLSVAHSVHFHLWRSLRFKFPSFTYLYMYLLDSDLMLRSFIHPGLSFMTGIRKRFKLIFYIYIYMSSFSNTTCWKGFFWSTSYFFLNLSDHILECTFQDMKLYSIGLKLLLFYYYAVSAVLITTVFY